MKNFIQNTKTILTDPFARYCFFHGIDEEEKDRIFRLSLHNPFTCLQIAKFYVSTGRDFGYLEGVLSELKDKV